MAEPGVAPEPRRRSVQCASPKGLQFNGILGHSANQENVNGSPATGLAVDDQVFLRPAIAEGVLLQFGDLVTVRGGKVQDHWPVYREGT